MPATFALGSGVVRSLGVRLAGLLAAARRWALFERGLCSPNRLLRHAGEVGGIVLVPTLVLGDLGIRAEWPREAAGLSHAWVRDDVRHRHWLWLGGDQAGWRGAFFAPGDDGVYVVR